MGIERGPDEGKESKEDRDALLRAEGEGMILRTELPDDDLYQILEDDSKEVGTPG